MHNKPTKTTYIKNQVHTFDVENVSLINNLIIEKRGILMIRSNLIKSLSKTPDIIEKNKINNQINDLTQQAFDIQTQIISLRNSK